MPRNVGNPLPAFTRREGASTTPRQKPEISQSLVIFYIEKSMKMISELVDMWRILIGGRGKKFTEGQRRLHLAV
jgi:hypothetical protein